MLQTLLYCRSPTSTHIRAPGAGARCALPRGAVGAFTSLDLFEYKVDVHVPVSGYRVIM